MGAAAAEDRWHDGAIVPRSNALLCLLFRFGLGAGASRVLGCIWSVFEIEHATRSSAGAQYKEGNTLKAFAHGARFESHFLEELHVGPRCKNRKIHRVG